VVIYLDECVSRDVAVLLRQRGVQLTTAQAEGTSGFADEDQIRYATANGWPILSCNERQFVGWHHEFRRSRIAHSGIITVPQRSHHLTSLRSRMLLDWIAAEHPDTRNGLFRWTDLQQSLNGGYALPGYTGEELAVALGRQG